MHHSYFETDFLLNFKILIDYEAELKILIDWLHS